MKIIQKTTIKKYRNFFTSISILTLSTSVLTTMKISENIKLKEHNTSLIVNTDNESILTDTDFAIKDLSLDLDITSDSYENFIGYPSNEFSNHLEMGFWEISENEDNYITYQNTEGDKITMYFDDKNIIEKIESIEIE